jgi:urocanate hydratase
MHETGIKLDNEHWYEHVPKSVGKFHKGKVIMLQNQQVRIAITIPNHKPDIIIRDNEEGTGMFIDVAISGDRNVIRKEGQKIIKYEDLTREIQHMRNV